jgi:hypothetical protein
MPTSRRDTPAPSILLGAARGAVGAMAMTGLRNVTGNFGLLEQAPPEAIVEQKGPAWVQKLDPRLRSALTELAHWSYGAFGGALYPVLPSRLRSSRWAGPAYGLAAQLAFELGIGPALGVSYTGQRHVSGRVMVAVDHVLYGTITAGQLARR